MFKATDSFIQNKNLQSVEIDSDLVMISEDQKNFISLNQTGKFIFDCLSVPQSMDEILQGISKQFEFDIDNASVSEDIQLLLLN